MTIIEQLDFLTLEEEEMFRYSLYDQVTYDRRQAGCMIDAMLSQLSNPHLTVDYKISLSRKVSTARRKWFDEQSLDLQSYTIQDLLRYSGRIFAWSQDLSNLFETNARMIRHRMSRIRELNYNRQRLQWCL